jgi:hypothetical protein
MVCRASVYIGLALSKTTLGQALVPVQDDVCKAPNDQAKLPSR